jgi:hypothetical protein
MRKEKNNQSKKGWSPGSNGSGPSSKHEGLSLNASTTKKYF